METTGVRFQLARMATALLLGAASAAPAATPAQKCGQAKNKEAGKYADCRQQVEAKFALVGDGAAHTAGLQKCLDKYARDWPTLESKAAAAGGVCPSVGDQGAIQTVIDAHTTTALAGGTLSDCPGDLGTCQSDLGTCHSDLGTCQADLDTCRSGTCQTDTLIGTAIVGNAVVDPSCSGNIVFNVSVQAAQPVSDPPTGSFYFQCTGVVDTACPDDVEFHVVASPFPVRRGRS